MKRKIEEESQAETDLHYAGLAEAFLRKMRVIGPITPPEDIALSAVIARLRRYAEQSTEVTR